MIKCTKSVELSAMLNAWIPVIASFAKPGAVIHVVTEVEDAPAAAWYEVLTGDVYIDLDQLPVHSSDLYNAAEKYSGHYALSDGEYSATIIAGIAVHELAHPRWTDWMRDSVDPGAMTTLPVSYKHQQLPPNKEM